MYSFEALQVLTFLLPGLLASALYSSLVYRKQKSSMGMLVEALIFTLVINAVYSIFFKQSPIVLETTTSTTSYVYQTAPFLLLLGLSVFMPCVLGFSHTRDWHMKLARVLKMSNRTARNSVWLDVFYDMDNWIIINFADQSRLLGYPKYYSHDEDEQFVFLTNAAWIVEDEYVQLSDAEGILITSNHEINSIEVLKDQSNEKETS